MVGRPSVEVLGDREPREVCLVERDLDLERAQHSRADVLAHLVHVVDRAGIAIRPDHARVARVRKLDGDRKLRACDFHRAGKTVTHAEQAADLAQVVSGSRRRNDEPRAVTNSQRRRDSSAISSWGRASAIAAYRPASPIRRNGNTAIDGRVARSCVPWSLVPHVRRKAEATRSQASRYRRARPSPRRRSGSPCRARCG